MNKFEIFAASFENMYTSRLIDRNIGNSLDYMIDSQAKDAFSFSDQLNARIARLGDDAEHDRECIRLADRLAEREASLTELNAAYSEFKVHYKSAYNEEFQPTTRQAATVKRASGASLVAARLASIKAAQAPAPEAEQQ